MARLRLLVILSVLGAAGFWSVRWGANTGHRFGDPLLAREMMYAGQFFADHGWATFGLPVYRSGAQPYTHLTPGPEWIQALFAVVRPRAISSFRWHSVLTAALSIACLGWLAFSLRRYAGALWGARAGDGAFTAVLLIATTPGFLLFSTHPYCAGMLLANAIALAVSARWAAFPDAHGWASTLAWSGVAVGAAFWLGVAPVVSSCIWLLSSAVRFGSRERRQRRVLSLFLVVAIVLIACVLLKFLQTVAVLGSPAAAVEDARRILGIRMQTGQRLPLTETFPARLLYLYAMTLPLLVWSGWRNRGRLVSEAPLIGAFWAGGLAWQVVMRGHATYHIYMLREAMVPVALTAAFLCASDNTEMSERAALWIAFAQLVAVLGILIVSLAVFGEPLWRLR